MPKRGKKAKVQQAVDSDEDYNSDNATGPDPTSNEYFHDEIDDFHSSRDKVQIDGDDEEADEWMHSDEEEVLTLDSEDSDDDDIRMMKSQLRRLKRTKVKAAMGSDVESEGEETGLPDMKAWGSNRKKYYMEEEDDGVSDVEDEEGEAAMEEKEALALQRKLAEQLDDQDFGLEIFKPAEKTETAAGKEEKIVKDLSKLSKREKLQLLKKESPELLTLIDELKEKLSEVQTKLQPMKSLIAEKKFTGKAADYIDTKFKLNLNYCINILFYLMLKAKHVPVHNHPVIQRLVQYRNLMKQLEPVDASVQGEMEDILRKLKKGEQVNIGVQQQANTHKTFVRRKKSVKFEGAPKEGTKSASKRRKLSDLVVDSDEDSDQYEDVPGSQKTDKLKEKQARAEGRYETKQEQEALAYYQMMKSGKVPAEEADEDNDDDEEEEDDDDKAMLDEEADTDGKRAIDYQIQKNKGLTPHRKKELRNPRVKHRMKYRKAKIRRKGQIREPRTEMQKYGGEMSGIRAGIKRGIRLK